MNKLLTLLILAFAIQAYAQVPAPAPAQSEPIAIMNGTVHIGNGKVIENGIVTFKSGKIELVVDALTVRMDLRGYKIIQAAGKHVYPGLILPVTNLGLVEIDAVRASLDHSEVGDLKPHVRSAIAYNTDSELIPTMKFTGIQLAQVSPRGGRVEGTSSIMQLDAWNWEDALYKEDDGVHINWPSLTFGPRWWMGETERRENKDYTQQVADIVNLIRDTRAYLESNPAQKNLILEGMKGVVTGNQSLFIYVNHPQEIVEAIQEMKKLQVSNVVLTGCKEAWAVRDLIKESGFPILLDNVHRLPGSADQGVAWPYELAARLHNHGILVGLTHLSDDVSRSRNLPFFAGTVAGYGVDKETALAMVTLHNARILRIDPTTGSLESGKDANVVISEGDLLDMRSNKVVYSFIQGREVDLVALQQRLYQKFKEKYDAQKP